MDYALPSHFDVVVVGTGLVESMVVGACARVGKKVLHLDNHDYYGARNATFDLRKLNNWLRGEIPDEPDDATSDSSAAADVIGAHAGPKIALRSASNSPARVSFVGGDEAARSAVEALLPQSSRYNVDLNPQLLLCAGTMIDILRASGVSNYLEFQPMQGHLYTAAAAAGAVRPLECVPCSKADIFQSSSIPLVQKRQVRQSRRGPRSSPVTHPRPMLTIPRSLPRPSCPPLHARSHSGPADEVPPVVLGAPTNPGRGR